MLPYRYQLKPCARRLRGDMTEAEQRLWLRLRRRQIQGVRFYRQKPLASYVVDFYAAAVRLVVEVDGGQHFEREAWAADRRREAVLRTMGLRVLRFDNRQVLLETEAVMATIWEAVAERIR
ncbi:endonuclease domain-containing protein [Lysobacter sp. cf310]|uniref:endonuclease domain-containing protein n=1 Tax=Lysobacter sp. cf310 TaxID=1761790 RepID=UPI0008E4C8B7|nr:endonuclease domain-containing protein [Lysobacter sp. cf310]SFL06349.1 Very-short-patch-repair endonuclease [Lysobacter sp. cf310]